MMAAGVTYGLLKQFDLPTAVTDLNTLGDYAVNQTVHTAARTVAEVTLTGRTDLKGASISVIAGTLGSYFASNIGMMHAHGLNDAEANLVHKTLHALNGAGQGLIMGVGKGILSQKGVTAEVLGEAVALAAAGALGSLVAETVADVITPTGGIAHQPASARPSAERIIATQAAARIVAGAVAMAAGMSPDQVQTAIFTATTAVENNCAKSATQAGQGKTKQTDDNGYDTNDEAEQSFVGKGRRAVLKAIGLEKVGQIIDDFRQKLGVDRTLAPIAAYPTDISVGEDAYIGACLDWTRDHVYERPMTTDETQVYRSVCKHAYMKMRENGAGQSLLSAAAAIATMIGNGVEAVLRYTGMTDKGNARAIGQSINDGLALYGLASIGKAGVQGLARQAKGLGKSAGAVEVEGISQSIYTQSSQLPSNYENIISQIPGRITSHADAFAVGPLPVNWQETFSGGRYAVMTLEKPLEITRVWAPGQSTEFGACWGVESASGALQSCIDKAIIPEWGRIKDVPHLRTRPTEYTIARIPVGKQIYVGEVSSQGGAWVGGTSQVIVEGGVEAAWKIGGGTLK